MCNWHSHKLFSNNWESRWSAFKQNFIPPNGHGVVKITQKPLCAKWLGVLIKYGCHTAVFLPSSCLVYIRLHGHHKALSAYQLGTMDEAAGIQFFKAGDPYHLLSSLLSQWVSISYISFFSSLNWFPTLSMLALLASLTAQFTSQFCKLLCAIAQWYTYFSFSRQVGFSPWHHLIWGFHIPCHWLFSLPLG